MSRRLLLRFYGITQWKNFRHDWFNFPSVDQLCDFSEIVRIHLYGNTRQSAAQYRYPPLRDYPGLEALAHERFLPHAR